MGMHAIELRWRGRCVRCAAELAAGELARFDDVTHEISCLDCKDRARVARIAAARKLASPPPSPRRSPAQSQAERRRIRALIADARAALAQASEAS
jgi:hypothetical protein